jgi:hypothetical protein
MRTSQKFMLGTIFTMTLVTTGMALDVETFAQTATSAVKTGGAAITATTAAGAGSGASLGHDPVSTNVNAAAISSLAGTNEGSAAGIGTHRKHPPATHVVAGSSSPSKTANIHAPTVEVHAR